MELDIENTGFVRVQQGKAAGKRDSFVWLDGQCDHKYLIHTAGFSYSAGEWRCRLFWLRGSGLPCGCPEMACLLCP